MLGRVSRVAKERIPVPKLPEFDGKSAIAQEARTLSPFITSTESSPIHLWPTASGRLAGDGPDVMAGTPETPRKRSLLRRVGGAVGGTVGGILNNPLTMGALMFAPMLLPQGNQQPASPEMGAGGMDPLLQKQLENAAYQQRFMGIAGTPMR
jgi:hypothetical protein